MVTSREEKIQRVDRVIRELESMKKKSFSSNELRSRDGMMGRLERIKEINFSKKINVEKSKLKDPIFLEKFFNQESEEEKDIISFLSIPKRNNLQRKRGGFFRF